jgi:hypothetical protein
MLGAGKSVLSAAILEKLLSSAGATVCYFFFRNGNPATSKSSEMIASIIDQLLLSRIAPRTTAQVLDVLKALYDEERSHPCRSFYKLWNTFQTMIRKFPTDILILLDALDECDDRTDFLRTLAASNLVGARFLVTSRPEQDIIDMCEKTSGPNFRSLEMDVDHDIRNFITQSITNDKRLAKFQDQIITTIQQNMDGMFRYAALMLEELKRPTSKSRKVSAALGSMPSGLYGMYELILLRLHPGDIDCRRKILLSITMAYRPMTVEEMAYAWAVEDADGEFDPEDYLLITADDIRRACGSLVEITDSNVLRFTHLSVKEFLLQSRETLHNRDKRIQYCLVNPEQAHILMAIACGKLYSMHLGRGKANIL